MPQPKPPIDDDATEGLPPDEGPAGELEVEQDDEDLAEGEGSSWLGDDGTAGIDVAGEPLDELEGASEGVDLDDSTLAIDDDPLELDPESTWTEGSEGDATLAIDEAFTDEHEPSAVLDDGAEGLAEAESELAELVLSSLGDDDYASDLQVAEADDALIHHSLPFADEPTFGIAALEGELVQVHARSLHVGALRIAIDLEPTDVLAGAVGIDEDHLLLWTASARALLLSMDTQSTSALPMPIRDASSERVGGILAVEPDGSVQHYPAAPTDGSLLGAPRLLCSLPGASRAVSSRRDPGAIYILGRGLRDLGGQVVRFADGKSNEVLIPAGATALAIDDDDWVMFAAEQELGRFDPGPDASQAPAAIGKAASPVHALLHLDRELVLLSAERASTLEIA